MARRSKTYSSKTRFCYRLNKKRPFCYRNRIEKLLGPNSGLVERPDLNPIILGLGHKLCHIIFDSIKGGRDDQNILTSVEFLPSRTKKNKLGEKKNKEFIDRYPALPYEMEGLSATEIKNVIYLIGTTRWQQESKVLSFEINGKAWKPETNLKRSRHSPIGKLLENGTVSNNIFHLAIPIGNEVWFIGGCCGVLPGVERLDVNTGVSKTHEIGTALTERYYFSAAYFNW